MKTKLTIAASIILPFAVEAFAHRLDEYLQATMISLQKDHVRGSMRLIPGVAVFATVLASIDTNRDGVVTEAEGQAYGQLVLRDVRLTIDGSALNPQVISVKVPSVDEMKRGLGQIQIEFSADLPGGGANRKLVFENHHQSRIAAYLVNCLVPQDRDLRVIAQNRNENQSLYELDYAQAGVPDTFSFNKWWSGIRAAVGNFAGIPSMFRLGMRHIAEGTDHLLFLLALLLPVPLVARRSSWSGFAGVRRSLVQILRIVTAFTIGHSITLALAALGFVHAPSRPIEVLIAISILVSAVHALRPLFPGREAAIAAFFGLIHGLAFAATLGQLGLAPWERAAGILGFNLGIETMQLIVVAATMPSIILLSRTRVYSIFRTGGGIFAGLAAAGWIGERLFDFHNSTDAVVDSVARHGVWIAGVLLLISIVCWVSSRSSRRLESVAF